MNLFRNEYYFQRLGLGSGGEKTFFSLSLFLRSRKVSQNSTPTHPTGFSSNLMGQNYINGGGKIVFQGNYKILIISKIIVILHSNKAIRNFATNVIVNNMFIIIQDLGKLCFYLVADLVDCPPNSHSLSIFIKSFILARCPFLK